MNIVRSAVRLGLFALALTMITSPGAAQEVSGAYSCASFVGDWSEMQQLAYVEGLKHGFGMAASYGEGQYNDATRDLLDQYESYVDGDVDQESFVLGMFALKESVLDVVEPTLERPPNELLNRLRVLCGRPENSDRLTASLMIEALREMDQ